MKQIPAQALILFIPLLVYSVVRYERIDEIWGELDDYETKIKRELSTYLVETSTEFQRELAEELEDLFNPEDLLPDDLEELVDTEAGNVDVDLPSEGTPDFEHFLEEVGYAAGEMEQRMAGMLELEDSDELDDIEEPLNIRYLVEQKNIDPGEIFEETRDMYKRYNKPSNVMAFIKIALISVVVITAGMIFIAALGFSVPVGILYGYVLAIILWAISETYLWFVINQEVEPEGRTPIGKFLAPDPREFF